MIDARALVPSSVSVLEPFVRAGVFDSAEVHLAATYARLDPEADDLVLLALAVAARGPRHGHVCVVLDEVDRLVVDIGAPSEAGVEWPAGDVWSEVLDSSALVASPAEAAAEPLRPLVWDGHTLYLQRYWQFEQVVAASLLERCERDASEHEDPAAAAALESALDSVFGPTGDIGDQVDLQRRAAHVSLTSRVSVIAGGPGTGKTHTVARLLAVSQLATRRSAPTQVALVAPTGKAAARMTESVRSALDQLGEGATVEGTTIHRLLGRGDRTRFRHDRRDPLPHDLVVVDETSMVDLPLMARLLDAVRPDARVVLVGDPFQLASVEAGTVLSDLVAAERGPLQGHVTVLRTAHRFDRDSGIAALADAVRRGDADAAVAVLSGAGDAEWIRPGDAAARELLEREVGDAAVSVATAALDGDGDAALESATSVKVLAATRHGPGGLYDWADRIQARVADRVPGLAVQRRWFVGRPVMVTANDPLNRVANGDVGVVVRVGPPDDPQMAVALAAGSELRHVAPSRLDRVETWWAMTIHKSQGSEFDHAVVSLPAAGSPILTRELLYTAVTRARRRVSIVADEESLRAAIDRPVSRASGLTDRLRAPGR